MSYPRGASFDKSLHKGFSTHNRNPIKMPEHEKWLRVVCECAKVGENPIPKSLFGPGVPIGYLYDFQGRNSCRYQVAVGVDEIGMYVRSRTDGSKWYTNDRKAWDELLEATVESPFTVVAREISRHGFRLRGVSGVGVHFAAPETSLFYEMYRETEVFEF